jgi:uncharacterized membrane protein
MAATIGVIAAGVAFFEVALIPGMMIGGAAVLAPKYLPKLRRRLQPLFNSTVRRRIEPAIAQPDRPAVKVPLAAGRFRVSRALAKTITFRTFATVMDFTTNYVVTGELARAAKLSAIGFVIGPFVYLGHERVWDYYGLPRARAARVSKEVPEACPPISPDRHLHIFEGPNN